MYYDIENVEKERVTITRKTKLGRTLLQIF